MVTRTLVVRADSAGCTEGFLAACRARNVGFFVTVRSNAQITGDILAGRSTVWDEVWAPAIDQDGDLKAGAAVCEVTSLIEDHKLPEATRCIIRREPLHPGAQRSLFPALDFRYWGFYTDQDGDPVQLDATMRAHAHVERHIQRLKDSGLCRFPFASFEANTNWMMVVAMAARPGALVPTLVLRRSMAQRPAQGHALGYLPRPGSPGAPLTPARRAHHWWLARHRRLARCLSTHRAHRLIRFLPCSSAPARRRTSRRSDADISDPTFRPNAVLCVSAIAKSPTARLRQSDP